MTREEKLKLLLNTGEYDFIKDIPKENMWKLIFALAYIENTIPMSDIDGIKAEIKTEISDYEGCADFPEGIRFGLRTALEIIDKHIAGKKGERMTREENIKAILECNFAGFKEEIIECATKTIMELKQELCEDAVSRAELLKYNTVCIDDSGVNRFCVPTQIVKTLPPVTPTRKKGKWNLLDECANSGYYCSECHKKVVKEGWSDTVKKIKYCPNCGAEMEGEE